MIQSYAHPTLKLYPKLYMWWKRNSMLRKLKILWFWWKDLSVGSSRQQHDFAKHRSWSNTEWSSTKKIESNVSNKSEKIWKFSKKCASLDGTRYQYNHQGNSSSNPWINIKWSLKKKIEYDISKVEVWKKMFSRKFISYDVKSNQWDHPGSSNISIALDHL